KVVVREIPEREPLCSAVNLNDWVGAIQASFGGWGFWLEVVRKAHWGIAEGTAAPDGENSRRGAEAQRGNGRGDAAASEQLSVTALAC
ncbi:MAG: hypothetical protein PHG55_11985, partial [Verrucomicrobiota bacterium]|nr:hypothetical protein [Verrucomicrobiota bacterium]